MKFKNGVLFERDGVSLHSAMSVALHIIEDAYYAEFNLESDYNFNRFRDQHGMTVTSLLDGKHGEHTLHIKGKAADIRTRWDDATYQWPDSLREKIYTRSFKS